MNHKSIMSTTKLFVIGVAYLLQACNGNLACRSPYTKTDGEFINSTKGRHFTAIPFRTIPNSTAIKCSLLLTGNSNVKSMCVLGESDVTCQLFEVKFGSAFSDGILVEKQDSSYYEKSDNFMKATSNAIVVGSKDDKPGSFNFQLPTGDYRIQLNHLTGGLKTNENQPFKNFGSIHPVSPSAILLMKGYKENILVQARQFTKYDGDVIKTKFVATSECFNLIQESIYSFWFTKDLKNNDEEDNYGETSFEMFVQLCENTTDCE